MTLDVVFILLLLSHVISDFYLQTDQIARDKDFCCKHMVWHGVIYAVGTFAILVAGLQECNKIWWLTFFVSSSHMLLDIFKAKLIKTPKAWAKFITGYIFTIDQSMHLICLIIGWYIWGRNVTVRWFLTQEIAHLPVLPITIVLAVLCVLRPVGIYIETGEIWAEFKKQQGKTGKNAGQVIGYLERMVILLFLLYNQYGAIAFVLTAKSVARYKEIETDKIKAEYYLIGTLTSVVSVFIIALLLGICGNGT